MKILREAYHTYRLETSDAEYILEQVADGLKNYLTTLFKKMFEADVDLLIDVKQESLIIKGLPDTEGDKKRQEAIESFIDIGISRTLDLSQGRVDYMLQFINDGVILIPFIFRPIDVIAYYLK